jgi:hypothetical protein
VLALTTAARRGFGPDLPDPALGRLRQIELDRLAGARLASPYDANDRRIFGTVIVVTDRTVLDSQLQEAIAQFEHKTGVIAKIDSKGVKSGQLAKGLVAGTPIINCSICSAATLPGMVVLRW